MNKTNAQQQPASVVFCTEVRDRTDQCEFIVQTLVGKRCLLVSSAHMMLFRMYFEQFGYLMCKHDNFSSVLWFASKGHVGDKLAIYTWDANSIYLFFRFYSGKSKTQVVDVVVASRVGLSDFCHDVVSRPPQRRSCTPWTYEQLQSSNLNSWVQYWHNFSILMFFE